MAPVRILSFTQKEKEHGKHEVYQNHQKNRYHDGARCGAPHLFRAGARRESFMASNGRDLSSREDSAARSSLRTASPCFRSGPWRQFESYRSLKKKKSTVNTRSTRITRKIDTTTARVVERPTCSAPAPVESPSWHPTAVILAHAKIPQRDHRFGLPARVFALVHGASSNPIVHSKRKRAR